MGWRPTRAGRSVVSLVAVALLVASAVTTPGVAGVAAGATTTDVSLRPASGTAEIGGTATFFLVVGSAEGGVGGYDLRLTVEDPAVAGIVEVSDSTNAGSITTVLAANGSTAHISTEGADTADSGPVTVARVTVRGVSAGRTDLAVGNASLVDERGAAYTVDGTGTATVAVSPPIEVTGTVTGPGGAPAAGDTLAAISASDRTTAATDAGGAFSLTAPGGARRIRVQYYQATVDGDIPDTPGQFPRDGVPDVYGVANVSRTADLGEVTLPPARVLRVSVVDTSGAPVADVPVGVAATDEGARARHVARTDDRGRLDLAGDAPPGIELRGEVSVTVDAATLPGFENVTVTRSFRLDGNRSVTVRLDRRIVPVVGDVPPTDPDGDGRYEDVDGNGEFNVFDVNVFLETYRRPAVQDNAAQFDFTGDGTVDVFDVSTLLDRVRG